MALTEERQEQSQSSLRRPTASQVLEGVGVLLALGTLGLGVLGTLPEHPVHEVGREVFGNIPPSIQVVFYLGVASFVWLMLHLFAVRARSWSLGRDEARSGRWGRRVRDLDAGLRMKTLLRDPRMGVIHAAMYYGFLVLFLGTVILEIDHILPGNLKFLHGMVYQGYSATLDLASLVFLAGVGLFAINRYVVRPRRIRTKTKPEDALILGLLALMGLTGILTEAARIALVGRPDFETWSFVGYPLSGLIQQSSAGALHQALWIFHIATFVAFLVVVPVTKLRHMFTSPANMFLSARPRPKGAMREMPNLLEAEDIDTIGASVVGDLTWKQIFDTDACTICGRCTSVCPANITGKPLDPREMVLKTGEVAASVGGVSGPVSTLAVLDGEGQLFDRVRPDEVFACVACRACDEICPVNIEILDRILDMRRYLTLMESEFPTELGRAFVSMENQANPWGLSRQARADWTKELDFEVPVFGENGKTKADYLWFVGCAGSYDDRNTAVSVALARLLHRAGIDFAILGVREACTGDPARRAGNELIYQQMALENIATFEEVGVTRVITQCAHCFNAIANEYPQLGGSYEVVHHSQLLAELLTDGRLEAPIREDGVAKRIAFHDPCYLGRHNDIYLAPREVIGSSQSVEIVEMPRHGTRALCCGAGGARFWMEEQTGKKINIERAEEAVATGADEIAIACPFCFVMLDDGVKELGRDDVRVRDLAMILADGMTDVRPEDEGPGSS
ncbi:MAG TPA: heterodisulfide reductase-related iron-sulfur binding cluster [Acidimicrobiia bacterium]|nr:heterodisulfide reductase-related iron-sulfur binding cluster [Acidimicrobiia bacterium]